MNGLKDCPFCGAIAKLESKQDRFFVIVRHAQDCPLRYVQIPPTFGKEAIIRKWNMRKIEKRRGIDDLIND